jgi:hypothetical protein
MTTTSTLGRADSAVAEVRNDQVGAAPAVEVCASDGDWTDTGGVLGGRVEAASRGGEEDGHPAIAELELAAGSVVCDRHVGPAVVVEIRYGDVPRYGAGRQVRGGSERAGAGVQEDGHFARRRPARCHRRRRCWRPRCPACRRRSRHRCRRRWARTGRVPGRRRERPGALVQQHEQFARLAGASAAAERGDVGMSVPVQITGGTQPDDGRIERIRGADCKQTRAATAAAGAASAGGCPGAAGIGSTPRAPDAATGAVAGTSTCDTDAREQSNHSPARRHHRGP